jgi:Protein of unknown function (DUF2867)
MRIAPAEFLTRDLRVHTLLQDVPLEDVWAIHLSDGGAGRTVQDVRAAFVAGVQAAPPVVQGLFGLRRRLGSLFGWDRPRPEWEAESFASRLSSADRTQSVIPQDTSFGPFSLLYGFPDEQLSELRNGTVHAFSSLSVRATPGGYLAYWAIYVRPVHRLTPLYMALITPFRRLIVYPAVIRNAQAAWGQLYGGAQSPVRA